MAEKNTLIPNEKLSSRERIERKIASFEGRPFTLNDVNRLLRPRMKLESIRFHLENLANNLLLEKLPRGGREKQLYVARDLLKDLEHDTNLNGSAHEYLTDLYNMTYHIRAGHVISQQQLMLKREQIRVEALELQEQVNDLLKLHDCTDLWHPKSLVNRLGFLEEIE